MILDVKQAPFHMPADQLLEDSFHLQPGRRNSVLGMWQTKISDFLPVSHPDTHVCLPQMALIYVGSHDLKVAVCHLSLEIGKD